jgi:predicted GH43/DUF377 family glycosyl hydrolase
MQKNIVQRSSKNPILKPTENIWENKAVFNPAAIELHGTIHLIYRAMSEDNTSSLGHAISDNGLKIRYRSDKPAYIPQAAFEAKNVPNGNSGCEDPRITQVGKRLYMCYTAFNGITPPAVALTSIDVEDFREETWKWAKPVLISQPGIDDKDACILPTVDHEKKNLFIHRLNNAICGSYIDLLSPVSQRSYNYSRTAARNVGQSENRHCWSTTSYKIRVADAVSRRF